MVYWEQFIKTMKILTVSELNNYIKNIINDDYILKNVSVEGEISNLKLSYGNYYFNLKDDNASIACIIFANAVNFDKNILRDGVFVKIKGRVSVYEKQGRYAIYINEIETAGLGKLYEELEKLKKELYERGMFDAMYKKEIPKYSNNVGIVTAKNGAAIKDIMKTMLDKNPYVRAVLYPAVVQGDMAKDSIVKGIEILDSMGLDVIIVGRGGGSKDDLNCFNAVEVAYAIFNAKTPIISAVGHEIDITIADMVADIRVATPTAAGNIATFDYRELMDKYDEYIIEIENIVREKIENYIEQLDIYEQRLDLTSPISKNHEKMTTLLYKNEKIKNLFYDKYRAYENRLENLKNQIKYLNPLYNLKNGMAYITDNKNNYVSTVKKIKKGDKLNIIFKDGTVTSIVDKINKKEM